MGTIAPGVEQPAQQPSRPLNHTVGSEPLNSEGKREANLGLVTKVAMEHGGTTDDPIVAQPRGARKIAVEGVEMDSDDNSGENALCPHKI